MNYTEKGLSEQLIGKIITNECMGENEWNNYHDYRINLEMYYITGDLNWYIGRCIYCGQPSEAKGYWEDWKHE